MIPQTPDAFEGWTTGELVRQWWYEYARVLREPLRLGCFLGLNRITDALERRGIVKPGVPMTREGANDLAAECDRLRGMRFITGGNADGR